MSSFSLAHFLPQYFHQGIRLWCCNISPVLERRILSVFLGLPRRNRDRLSP
jgi:hypothetical protein